MNKIISKNWQKTCSSEDYVDEDFRYVLEKIFNQGASYHRKQWEFVVIYLNLVKYGKLTEGAVGASFGAGRERLIFDVSKHVKKFFATDLYIYNTAWATAKIEKGMSCYDFVLEKAPNNFNSDGLEVLEMDMRLLNFDNSSLDFCYSSCAVEHIGHFDDFVSHLKEVKRVLKDDGLYVMTTEHLFAHQTIAVKGNYKFDFEYLKKVFEAADFFPEKEFDARLTKSFLNKPKPDLLALNGVNEKMLNFFPSLIISKQGVPYTSSCFVFHKSDKSNLETTMRTNQPEINNFLLGNIKSNVLKTYEDYQSLDPTMSLRRDGRIALADHMEYLADDYDQFVDLTPVSIKHFAFTDFIYFDDFDCKVFIQLNFSKSTEVKMELIERPQSSLEGRVAIKKIIKKIEGNSHTIINFKAQKDKVYAVALYATSSNHLSLVNLDIKAKILKE